MGTSFGKDYSLRIRPKGLTSKDVHNGVCCGVVYDGQEQGAAGASHQRKEKMVNEPWYAEMKHRMADARKYPSLSPLNCSLPLSKVN